MSANANALAIMEINKDEVWEFIKANLKEGTQTEELFQSFAQERGLPINLVISAYQEKISESKHHKESDWDSLDKILEEWVFSYYNNEEKPEGGLSALFKRFSDEYGKGVHAVKYHYYHFVKPELDKRQQENKPLTALVRSPGKGTRKLNDLAKGYKEMGDLAKANQPKVGETIEVEIDEIRPYGVFGVTEHGYRGLIHISEVCNDFLQPDQLEEYFHIGEKVQIKVIQYDPDKGWKFSCRALGGKTVHMLPKSAKPSPVGRYKYISNGYSLSVEKELKELIDFLSKHTGDITAKAQEEMRDLISVYGVAKVTIYLSQTIVSFDKSLAIVKHTREVLDNEFNRV
ncbi:MAG: S1 RNA-binding domain-containing protein [Bacillota bacterium]